MSIFQQFDEREQEILRMRAERVAGRSGGTQAETAALTALLITMQGERYAIPIESIQVVHQDVSIEDVPCTPNYVAGIANVRGHILPVIDLAKFLDIPSPELNGSVSILVAGNSTLTVAFYVEEVGDVAPLAMEDLAPIPATFGIDKTIHLQGVMPDGTVLLDVEAILDDPALIVDEQIGK